MDLFDGLTLLGGLCLFLFGMNSMSHALQRSAGNRLSSLLAKLTSNRFAGLLTGIGITALIQSSSATTVMVVGFVNSDLMNLSQAINVIMGANVGTTVTAWILSLTGIASDNVFLKLLSPVGFTPILAAIGVVLYVFNKKPRKQDIGAILLGFSTLMYGMQMMSNSVAGLQDVPSFQQFFLLFENPLFGVLAGTLLTCIIQSSAASIGILQALASTGAITYASVVPIIMGDAIGTCITAMLSSIGTNKQAKRAALAHLSINVIATAIWLTIYCLARAIFAPPILSSSATLVGIAAVNSIFKVAGTATLWPMNKILEKIVVFLVPDSKKEEEREFILNERQLDSPSTALEQCRDMATRMANEAVNALKDSLACLKNYSKETAERVREAESRGDHYEDILGSYLVKLSIRQISEKDSTECGKLLKIIGDYERISDHAVNIVESAEEMRDKKIAFSGHAKKELEVLCKATLELLEMSKESFLNNDIALAYTVEPLEQVIDHLKEEMRSRHIQRLQQGECSIDVGFVWSDLLTDLERTSDHCSNIAGTIIDAAEYDLKLHEFRKEFREENEEFTTMLHNFAEKYSLSSIKTTT
ncbi:MAG: Na/Pi cotransporter family protein [Clostridia bacterium]|nr:Na/Pi cotransporter family protein [Clostridia bacterium]